MGALPPFETLATASKSTGGGRKSTGSKANPKKRKREPSPPPTPSRSSGKKQVPVELPTTSASSPAPEGVTPTKSKGKGRASAVSSRAPRRSTAAEKEEIEVEPNVEVNVEVEVEPAVSLDGDASTASKTEVADDVGLAIYGARRSARTSTAAASRMSDAALAASRKSARASTGARRSSRLAPKEEEEDLGDEDAVEAEVDEADGEVSAAVTVTGPGDLVVPLSKSSLNDGGGPAQKRRKISRGGSDTEMVEGEADVSAPALNKREPSPSTSAKMSAEDWEASTTEKAASEPAAVHGDDDSTIEPRHGAINEAVTPKAATVLDTPPPSAAPTKPNKSSTNAAKTATRATRRSLRGTSPHSAAPSAPSVLVRQEASG